MRAAAGRRPGRHVPRSESVDLFQELGDADLLGIGLQTDSTNSSFVAPRTDALSLPTASSAREHGVSDDSISRP
jgi:hypothetical protein